MKIQGKELANEILEKLKIERKRYNFEIKFKIITFKNDVANASFIKIKKSFAEKLDIKCDVHYLDESKTNKELRKEINKIAREKFVKGVIIQLPIPKGLNHNMLINAIPEKVDTDCLTYRNLGKFYQNRGDIMPPTVSALDFLIKKFDLKLGNVLLVGQGELIGKPIAQYLINNKIQFNNINSSCKNINELCLEADSIITGVGLAGLICSKYIKDNSNIFDYGCSKKEKICGDCEDSDDFEKKCNLYAPVPNGVGPIVVAKLFENLFKQININ